MIVQFAVPNFKLEKLVVREEDIIGGYGKERGENCTIYLKTGQFFEVKVSLEEIKKILERNDERIKKLQYDPPLKSTW